MFDGNLFSQWKWNTVILLDEFGMLDVVPNLNDLEINGYPKEGFQLSSMRLLLKVINLDEHVRFQELMSAAAL